MSQDIQEMLERILTNQQTDRSELNIFKNSVLDRLTALEAGRDVTSTANFRGCTTSRSLNAHNQRDSEDDDIMSDNASFHTNSREDIKNLSEDLKVIPEFNGDDMSIETFLFEIKIALKEIPENLHNRFIRLIKAQKIKGKARQALEGADIRNITDFQNILRLHFGDIKTLDNARFERSMCMQHSDRVLEYNRRFLNAQLNVRRAISNDPFINTEHKKYAYEDEEKHGLSQYIRGLNQTIRLSVRSQRPITIREAQNLALETEREEELVKQTEFRSRTMMSQRAPTNNKRITEFQPRGSHTTPTLNLKKQWEPRVKNDQDYKTGCYNCGENGHISRNCPKKQNFPGRKNPNAPPVRCISQEPEETPEPNYTSETEAENTCDFWQTLEQA